MPPKPPPGLKFTVEERTDGDLHGICVRAVDAHGGEAGRVCVRYDGTTPWVGVSHAKVSRVRQGVGTKLYERIAAVACRRFKLPLASDAYRSYDAQAFWQKQVAKRRAICLKPADRDLIERDPTSDSSSYGRGKCDRYVLKCPAPRSLAGRRGRR